MKLVYCTANIYLLVYISHFLPIISRRHLKHTADKCTCAWEFKKPFIFCFITLRYIQAKINEQILTSMCHVTKTIKINNHKQRLKGCTLIKRLLLAANYNTMISQPLPRVFSFHNMAKAGKENQYGFSVLPAAARLENLGAKLGCCQLHTSHNAPCLRKHCFQFLQKKLKTKFM